MCPDPLDIRVSRSILHCIVGYNYHLTSLTAIIRFAFTKDYFGIFVGHFFTSSGINHFRNVLLYLSFFELQYKKRAKSLEGCLVKKTCFISN